MVSIKQISIQHSNCETLIIQTKRFVEMKCCIVFLLCLFAAASEGTTCTSKFVQVQHMHHLSMPARRGIPKHRTRRMANQGYFGKQALFTDLSFNCSGLLTHWIFTAAGVKNKGNLQAPELHVWRNTSSNRYVLVHSTLVYPTSYTGTNQLYNMSLLSNPLLVQAGDVLGIFQPEKKKSLFSISYSNSNSGFTTTVYLMKSKTHLNTFSTETIEHANSGVPLVNAVIVPIPSSSSSVMISDQVTVSSLSSSKSSIPSLLITSSPFSTMNISPSSATSPTTSSSLSHYTVVPFSSSVLHTSLELIQPTRVSPSTLKTKQTTLMVASGSGLKSSFNIVLQSWATSKHSTTVTANHNADNDTPSYPTVTPSLAAQLGNGSVTTYIIIIAVLLGLTIISTTIAATAFCVVVAIGRKKSKPVVTVIYPSTTSHLERNSSPTIITDENTCPHTVCNLEPVPIYEGASLVRGNQQNESQLQTCQSDTFLSGQTETLYISITGEPESSGGMFTQPVLNPNYDRIETNNRSNGEQVNSSRQHTKPPVSPYEMPFESGNSSLCGYDLCVPDEYQRQQLVQNSGYEFDQELYESLVQQTQPVQEPAFFEEAPTYWQPSSSASTLYTQLSNKRFREIPRQLIEITEYLGSGQFGTVNKATWKSRMGETEVAVKMLKAGASETEKVKFLQEAAINGQFHHQNVVKLLGMVTVGEPAMIVLELVRNGNLRKFLSSKRPRNGKLPSAELPELLLDCCRQVASGMVYLASKAFVHRDLAARNILVSDELVLKVADFGMSRDLMEKTYYVSQGGPIPIKWTAPEALYYRKYSTYSDVWSFGVVMYEIWSIGRKPFPSLTNEQYIEEIDEGHRLLPPPGCPRRMYQLMIDCWHPDSSCRPSFETIENRLRKDSSNLLEFGATETELTVCPEACLLGTRVESGQHLFQDLQQKYWMHS